MVGVADGHDAGAERDLPARQAVGAKPSSVWGVVKQRRQGDGDERALGHRGRRSVVMRGLVGLRSRF